MNPNGQHAPPTIQPQPTPFSWALNTGMTQDGSTWTLIQLSTVVGMLVLFMSRDDAAAFGKALISQGTGLVLPE